MDMTSKAYQPTQAHDENGNDRGVFASPFLAKGREEWETTLGTTTGDWTYAPTTDPRD